MLTPVEHRAKVTQVPRLAAPGWPPASGLLHTGFPISSLGFPLVDRRVIPGDSLAPPVSRAQRPEGVDEAGYPS